LGGTGGSGASLAGQARRGELVAQPGRLGLVCAERALFARVKDCGGVGDALLTPSADVVSALSAPPRVRAVAGVGMVALGPGGEVQLRSASIRCDIITPIGPASTDLS
jgi:hypothetical protein